MCWDTIYSLFEKISYNKHISLLKNTRVKNVIIPIYNDCTSMNQYDFVLKTKYAENRKKILQNSKNLKKYIEANCNVIQWISCLAAVRYRGSIHAALCLYASVCDFEQRKITCSFSLQSLKREISRFLKSVNVPLSFSKSTPIFDDCFISEQLLCNISMITLEMFVELSILNLDYLTRNYYIVHYITTNSTESELSGTYAEQVQQVVDYWKNHVDESLLSVDFSEAHERCWACGMKRKLQFCHIIPDALGGERVPSNLVLLCKYCHRLAPNVDNKDAMWDYLRGHKVSLYDTYWMNEAKREYELMYHTNYEEEIRKVSTYAEEKGIDLSMYFDKAYMHANLPKVTNHFGERINASTWAFVEYKLLYNIKRDLGILPVFRFNGILKQLGNANYYVDVPKKIEKYYRNRVITVKVQVQKKEFICQIEVSLYTIVYIPLDIIEVLHLKEGDSARFTIMEYIKDEMVDIPKELDVAFTPDSIRYFTFLSYTDKMKFIDYINSVTSYEEKEKRVKECISLLENYKKFQER